jgi:hypothetical protein
MIKKINDKVANLADAIFSSIVTAYAFIMLSLIPLIVSSLMSPILYISNCIQLAALPALGVSNAVQARTTRKLMQEMHDAVLDELSEIKKMHADLTQLLKEKDNDKTHGDTA